MKPILGKTSSYWASVVLGTGYMQFHSTVGVDGLAQELEDGNRLDILAVNADKPGTGQFREFIKQCKESYSTICIWVVENPTLEDALLRYGFTPEVEIKNDEPVKGLRWDKPHEQQTGTGSVDKAIPDNLH